MDHVSPDMSFLEMLDVLNNDLIKKGEEPVAFDHDCREGICGMCSLYINGRPHGPLANHYLPACTCDRLTMEKPLPLNPGEQRHFR